MFSHMEWTGDCVKHTEQIVLQSREIIVWKFCAFILHWVAELLNLQNNTVNMNSHMGTNKSKAEREK